MSKKNRKGKVQVISRSEKGRHERGQVNWRKKTKRISKGEGGKNIGLGRLYQKEEEKKSGWGGG